MTTYLRPGFALPDGPVVLASRTDGTAIVPTPNPLTRLHFFDGRLLKGDDLTVEQNAERTLDMLLAQAGGSGVAWGLDVGRSGETLTVSPGLAFDPSGRPLLVPSAVELSIAELLGSDVPAREGEEIVGRSAFGPCVLGLPVEVSVDPVAAATAYLLTVGWVEGYCGTMDIYGAACEQACVSGTDRPYRVDGVVFRLRALSLRSPLPTSSSVVLTSVHLRSRLAAAYFADERAAAGVPLSAASLGSAAWCSGGSEPTGAEVPLAMVVRFGRSTGFHDEWVARRERMETPARVAFDGRMEMRARAVFAAQVAQFQCQLADRLGTGGLPAGAQRLIDGGIVELPPCGYLPVDPGADVVAQVTAMMGSGVDLRFVPVPADAIPHKLEAARHRDRISLLTGLDDPGAKPPVDVLVPGGAAGGATATGQLFRAQLSIASDRESADNPPVVFTGTARLSHRGTGFTLSAAGLAGVTSQDAARRLVSSVAVPTEQAAATETDQPVRRLVLRRTAGSSAAVSLDTLRAVAAKMPTYAERVRGGEQAALPSAQFARDDAKPIAGRAVLVVDQDPWSLTAEESAFVHLAVDVVTPVANGTSASIDLIGRLGLQSGSPTGAAPTRAFRFSGQASLTERADPPQLTSVDVSATVERSPIPDSGQDRYLVSGVPELLELLSFGGSPFTITAMAARNHDRLQLVEDPSVADPNSELKQHADLALQLLRAARPGDTQFYERTQLATFGAASAAAAALVADRDWVAFRRRPPAPPAAAAPPRTVQVWVYGARDEEDAQRARKLLLGGDGDQLDWQRVAAVGFDAATGAIVTDAAVVQSGYAGTGAGPSLELIGYGPGSMPSGAARATAVVAALGPGVHAATGVEPQPLTRPPSGFLDASTDGSIFLIATDVPKAAALLQVAVAMAGRSQASQDLVKLLSSSTVNRQRLEAAVGEVVTMLGSVSFTGDQPDVRAMHDVEVRALQVAGASNYDPKRFPVLWIDERWAAQNGALARAVYQAAEQLARAIAAGHQENYTLRRVVGNIGVSPTPAVLIEVFGRAT